MDKLYYQEYFEIERNHWWFKARKKILSSYIRKNINTSKNHKILNVGAATGESTIMLQEFGEVTSLEYEQDCIDFIKDKVPITVTQGSIANLPFPDNSFDLVCAFDVIEHVEDDTLAANELIRVCSKNGSILVTVPAFMFLWSEHDKINHHFRRYNVGNLRSLFDSGLGHTKFLSYFNTILFAPIFILRSLSLVFRNKGRMKSDFEKYKPGLSADIFYKLMKSERRFLNRKIRLPIGVSILLDWQKHS